MSEGLIDRLATRIDAFNATLAGHPRAALHRIVAGVPADEAALRDLAVHWGAALPDELLALYRRFGALAAAGPVDGCGPDLPSATTLLNQLAAGEIWQRRDSLGLVDAIRHAWSNDREEFDGLDPERVALLNREFRCFGLWHGDDHGEGHHYLYADRQGRFGAVYYHQDGFEDLLTDHLDPMAEQSPARQTLCGLLGDLVDWTEGLLLAKQHRPA